MVAIVVLHISQRSSVQFFRLYTITASYRDGRPELDPGFRTIG